MEYTSLSARVWRGQYEIIEKAAKKLNVSIGEYIRTKIMPHAFKDAGVTPKEFPPFVRGRPTPTGEVAAKLGIPRKQLEKAWLDRIATLALKEFTDEEEEPPKKSDFRELAAPEVIRRRKTGS